MLLIRLDEDSNIVRIGNDAGEIDERNVYVGSADFEDDRTVGEHLHRRISLALLVVEFEKCIEGLVRI